MDIVDLELVIFVVVVVVVDDKVATKRSVTS